MDKKGNLCRFTPDYEECSSRYEEIETFIKNPEKFIELMNDKPNLIFSDKVIKKVVNIYVDVCKLGTPDESEHAKNTLRKAGISSFIPKEARVKRSESTHYRWYKQNPLTLLWSVEYLKTLIKPYLKEAYRSKNGEMSFHEKDKDILIAFEKIMGFEPNEDEAYLLTQGERTKDLTHIALSFFIFNPADPKELIPFESIKDLYYEASKQNSDMKERIAENVFDNLHFGMDGFIGYFEYIMILNS